MLRSGLGPKVFNSYFHETYIKTMLFLFGKRKTIEEQKIFSDRIFLKEIMRPVLSVLGTSRDELKELNRQVPGPTPDLVV